MSSVNRKLDATVEQAREQLEAAVEEFHAAEANALGISQAVMSQAKVAADRAFAEAENALRIRSTRADKENAQAMRTAAEAARSATKTVPVVNLQTAVQQRPAPLQAAEYVSLGTGNSKEDGSAVPALVPLLDHANLLVSGSWDNRILGLMESVCLQAVLGTGPGQLKLLSIDPSLRSPLAALQQLKTANEDLMPTSADTSDAIIRLLKNLYEDIRQVKALTKGAHPTLGSFRRSMKQPLETYQLVTVCDYPQGFNQESSELLTNVMREGRSAGISFLIHHSPERSRGQTGFSDDHKLPEITALAYSAAVEGGQLGCSWMTNFSVALPGPLPRTRVDELMGQALSWARDAQAPTITFDTCMPPAGIWSDSTADGFVATLGMSGHEPASILLGDDTKQRHNVLVTGAVGQGKSNLLLALIHSMAARYSPSELEFYLLDFKEGMSFAPLGAGLSPAGFLPHVRSLGINSDRQFGVAVLRHLTSIFALRARQMRSHGDSVSKYRAATGEDMARIVVVIDEFQVLFEERDELAEEALTLLESLARKGRAYGIHLFLASQTLSGIALGTKEETIFAQFPVRLALKNSSSESQKALGQDNKEAARLRYRGEMVLNENYGAVDSNRRATVAFADEKEVLLPLRREMVKRLQGAARRPHEFDGGAEVPISEIVNAVRVLREQRGDITLVRQAVIGHQIGIGAAPASFPIQQEAGRHLVAVGGGETDTAYGTTHVAIGSVQAAALSLAMQHPGMDATFVVLSLLPPDVAQASGLSQLIEALEYSGNDVVVPAAQDIAAYLASLVGEIQSRYNNPHPPSTYVVAFGLDRLPRYEVDLTVQAPPGITVEVPDSLSWGAPESEPSDAGTYRASPQEGVKMLLTEGPNFGLHLLSWWSTYQGLESRVPYTEMDGFQGRVGFQISKNDMKALMQRAVNFPEISTNRAYYSDTRLGQEPMTIIPVASMTDRELRILKNQEWN